ncbi:MAG: DNA mismatch repair protein MutS [Chitinivibrionales bacterium]|nr:DNA mismatch repair protein MutS [Chitinivibrionales bacterium]
MKENDPIRLPINGILDLHTFRPRDVKRLIPDYLNECRKKGIFEIYIIHGKGKGILREKVHAVLRRLPEVVFFYPAPEQFGGWGATVVELSKKSSF